MSLTNVQSAVKELADPALKEITLVVDNFDDDDLIEALKCILKSQIAKAKSGVNESCTLQIINFSAELHLPENFLLKFDEVEARMLYQMIKQDADVIDEFLLGIELTKTKDTDQQYDNIKKSGSLSRKQKSLMIAYLDSVYLEPGAQNKAPPKSLIAFRRELLKDLDVKELNVLLSRMYEKTGMFEFLKLCMNDMVQVARPQHNISSAIIPLLPMIDNEDEKDKDHQFLFWIMEVIEKEPAELSKYMRALSAEQFLGMVSLFGITEPIAYTDIFAMLVDQVDYSKDIRAVMDKFDIIMTKEKAKLSKPFETYQKANPAVKLTVALTHITQVFKDASVSSQTKAEKFKEALDFLKGLPSPTADWSTHQLFAVQLLGPVLKEAPSQIELMFRIFFGLSRNLDEGEIEKLTAKLLPSIITRKILKTILDALRKSLKFEDLPTANNELQPPTSEFINQFVTILKNGKLGTILDCKDLFE